MRARWLVKVVAGIAGLAVVMLPAYGETVIKFDGSGSYVDMGTPAALQMKSNSPFTIEGWIRCDTLGRYDTMYGKNSNRSSPYTYMFGYYEYNQISAYDGKKRVGLFTVSREAGRWYHLAFSFDGSDITFYVDGAEVGSAAFTYTNNEAHRVQLGGYSSATDINGSLSEMRVWDHARNGAEIRSMMNWRLPSNTAGLHAYWPLNEGSGTNVYDLVNNVATGSFVNVVWEDDGELSTVLPAVAPFSIVAPPVLAANKAGARYMVYTNEVALREVTIGDECDLFQITTSPLPSAIKENGWLELAELPETLTFVIPESESESVYSWYFWFTNSSESVALAGSAVEVSYVPGVPLPPVAIFSGGSYDGYAFDEAAEPGVLPGPQVGLSWGADRLLDVRGLVIEAEDITITESLDSEYLGLTGGSSMTIAFPAQAALRWDITSLTYGGTAAAKAGSATVSEDGSALVIPLLADFAAAQTLILQGLKIRGGVMSPQLTGRLRLDYDSNGIWDSYDEHLTTIGMLWPGGSYDGAAFDEAVNSITLRPKETIILLR